MKSNKLTYLLVFALAVTMAATGCKHKPVGVTPLPLGSGPVGEPGPGPEKGVALNPNETPPGGGPLPDWSPEDMIQDRAALEAHTVHFDFDSAVVKSSEQANVAAVAAALQSDAAAKLLIEGHCDERGTEEYNRSLGERRALALREALAKGGVDSNRIRTISYGKDKPADSGHNESAWRKNRRGEFVLLHPKQ